MFSFCLPHHATWQNTPWIRCVSSVLLILLGLGFLGTPGIAQSAKTISHKADSGAPGEGHPGVYWQGEKVEPGTLPDRWEARAKARVQELQEWVQSDRYSISISLDQRVILLSPAGKAHQKRWKLVQQVMGEYDKLLGTPERDLSGETYRVASRGIGEHRPDSEPVVLIEAGDDGAYSRVVKAIAREHPHLNLWSESALQQPGFVESSSQTGAWMQAPDGFEVGDVWRSENELVHRLGSLLLNRSYGTMPHWLRTSVGWHLEQSVLGSIYHFPMRHEFVSVADHSGWKSELRKAFKKSPPVDPAAFADWDRATWKQDKAEIAWGMLQFLHKSHPDQVGALAEALRLHYKANSIVDGAGGSWSRVPGYEIPVAEQADLLRQTFGEEVFEDAGRFFRTWKVPKKKSSKKSSSKSRSKRTTQKTTQKGSKKDK